MASKGLEELQASLDDAGDVEVLEELQEISAEALAQAGRGSAGRPARERRADVGDPEGRERHPHRAVRERAARPLPHRRDSLQHHEPADEVPRRDRRRASRSCRSSTSPRSGCRRTAASRSGSTSSGAPKEIDFRVSVLPTLFGEKIVMRLLDKDKLMLDMTKLGFEPESLAKFEAAILRPWGMVLVTGPTGSGKTNTLYSSIAKINTPETNIMTAEDPVEFNLAGINQVQVQGEHRPELRGGAALVPPPGPEHHPGRRDSRLRDRRDRGQGGAHRPSGALDAAHQRRAEHDQPADEHGHRAVPRRELGASDLRAAPRAPRLRQLQGARAAAAAGARPGRLHRRSDAERRSRR